MELMRDPTFRIECSWTLPKDETSMLKFEENGENFVIKRIIDLEQNSAKTNNYLNYETASIISNLPFTLKDLYLPNRNKNKILFEMRVERIGEDEEYETV